MTKLPDDLQDVLNQIDAADRAADALVEEQPAFRDRDAIGAHDIRQSGLMRA